VLKLLKPKMTNGTPYSFGDFTITCIRWPLLFHNNYEFWVKLISREKAVTEVMLLCRSDICRRRAVISRSDHPVIYSGSLIECNVRL